MVSAFASGFDGSNALTISFAAEDISPPVTGHRNT
jgi:hypothetical protein